LERREVQPSQLTGPSAGDWWPIIAAAATTGHAIELASSAKSYYLERHHEAHPSLASAAKGFADE
jgi:hypothetical protein